MQILGYFCADGTASCFHVHCSSSLWSSRYKALCVI